MLKPLLITNCWYDGCAAPITTILVINKIFTAVPVRAASLFLFLLSFLAIIGRVDDVHKPL
jgi:hypothetical protein